MHVSLKVGLLASAVFVAMSGVVSAGDLKLVTGPQGGSWYPLGGALKNLIEKQIPGTDVKVGPGAGNGFCLMWIFPGDGL